MNKPARLRREVAGHPARTPITPIPETWDTVTQTLKVIPEGGPAITVRAGDIERLTVFDCHDCGKTIEHWSGISTGYGIDSEGNKVCFACCAVGDRERMAKDGRIDLYLTTNAQTQSGWAITNWPGTLVFPCGRPSRSRHNLAGTRHDVWFQFDGCVWHAVQYGENTQIAHCRRTKRMAQPTWWQK